MTYLERAVRAIESGLVQAGCILGHPQRHMALREHMSRYNVPGCSAVDGDGSARAVTAGGHWRLERVG